MEAIFDETPRDQQAQIAMEAMLENYPNDSLIRVMSFPNSNFSDPEKVPSGVLAVHPLDAEIHPDSIPDEMFEYLLVAEIDDPEKKLTDNDFAGKEKLLGDTIPQYSSNPPRLVGLKTKDGDDAKTWSVELGKNGYAGIFKQISPNGRDTDYFVVVKAGAPQACKEFKKLVINGEKRKFADMMMDGNFNYVKHIAKRNAQRLAHCVAKAVGMETRVPRIPDVSAFTSASYIAQPYRIEPAPGHCQEISTIEPLSFQGQPCVGVYHKVRSSCKSADTCFVMSGPYEGITKFNMRGNATGYGTPVDTGILGPGDSNVSKAEMERRARGFVWEGKDSGSHPELLPGRHQPVDDKFLQKMKECGWKQEGVENRKMLTPVIVKLGNPELERK